MTALRSHRISTVPSRSDKLPISQATQQQADWPISAHRTNANALLAAHSRRAGVLDGERHRHPLRVDLLGCNLSGPVAAALSRCRTSRGSTSLRTRSQAPSRRRFPPTSSPTTCSKAPSRRRWRASTRSEYVGAVQYLAVLENELSGWIPP
jgi:hypothetical protein